MTVRDLLVRGALPLNAIRLGLALLVLLSHSYPLSGSGGDPGWPLATASTTIGGFAVGAFFALSGLLVTMSGVRRTPYEFIRSRFLRLMPAYTAVLVFVACVLAPAVWLNDKGTLDGYLNTPPNGPVAYLLRNLTFPVGLPFSINDVFATKTDFGRLTGASQVNGSIWTLPLEVRCYAVALCVVVIGRALGTTRVAVAALGAVAGLHVLGAVDLALAAAVTPEYLAAPMPDLLFVFLCGAVLGSVADELRVTTALVLGALAVHVLCAWLGGAVCRTLGLGLLALLLPVAAALVPDRRIGFLRHDLSYSTYLWGFPVQQSLNHAGLRDDLPAFFLLSCCLTLVAAAGSWFLVERPALKLRHRRADADASVPRAGAAVDSSSATVAGGPEPAMKG